MDAASVGVSGVHTVVLGGASSGKSGYAEALCCEVRTLYVATGPAPSPEDAEWCRRVQAHRVRRPAHWQLAETVDLAGVLSGDLSGVDAVLIDSLTTWVSSLIDEAQAWGDAERGLGLVREQSEALVAALQVCPVPVVMVSDETGLGGVAADAGTRMFREALGRVTAACLEVAQQGVVVVAGSPLAIKGELPTPLRSAVGERAQSDAETSWVDAWRLAVGTMTRLTVTPPRVVTPMVAGRSMLLAWAAVIPLAVGWAVVLLLGAAMGVPALAVGAAAYAWMTWGTRLLHVDGLADTVDGLCAGWSAERVLAVMKSPTAGPGGIVAVGVTLVVQAAAAAALLKPVTGWEGITAAVPAVVLGAWAVVWSRHCAGWACRVGVPAARQGGLGAGVAGSVAPWAWWAVAFVLVGVASGGTAVAGGAWWAPVAVAAAGWVGAQTTLAAARKACGGVTGDVIGAVVEVAATVGVVAAVCVLAG